MMNERHILVDTIIKKENPTKSDDKFKIKSSDIVTISMVLIGLILIFNPYYFDTVILSIALGTLFLLVGFSRR